MDPDSEVSQEPFGSSLGFDPSAPEFQPGDSSLESDVWGSRDGSRGEAGSSRIFSGGENFLSKYQRNLRRSDRGQPLDSDREARQPRRRCNEGSSDSGFGKDLSKGSECGSEGSAPYRMNVQLNSLLVHARTVDKILQVVDAHFSSFNAVNMITALHRLATVVVAARSPTLRRDARFKRLIQRLADTLRNADTGALKPQDLSNVVWALTKLGLLNASLFSHLADHIMRTINNFEPVNLSMTLWAFARSGFLDERLFRTSVVEVKRQLPGFQPQQIANTTWALAKSGFVDEELFAAAAELALKKLEAFQPMNFSMLLYSFALAKHPHPRLFEEVGKRCTEKALMSTSSPPHLVTNLAIAFAEAGAVNGEVFDTIAKVAKETLHEFRTQQIAALAQAFARAQVKNDRFFAAISAHVRRRSHNFRPQDLQDLMAAYESLGLPTSDLARALESGPAEDLVMSPSLLWSFLSGGGFVLLVVFLAWHLHAPAPALH